MAKSVITSQIVNFLTKIKKRVNTRNIESIEELILLDKLIVIPQVMKAQVIVK